MFVLCVCSGNTCRSPMAAGLLQQKAAAAALPLTVASAGLAAMPGDAASENAVRVMAEVGVDLSAHRSAALTTDLLFAADAVFCMNNRQKAVLSRYIAPETVFVPDGGIPDPYGGDEAAYRRCRDALDAATDAFLAVISAPVVAPMTADDVAAVAELERLSFSTPWSAASLAAELDNDNAHFFVLRVCGEIVGYAGLHLICGEGYLTNVAVHPSARRKGYGKTLVQAAIDCCRNAHARFLSLEVRKSNLAAQNLYAALGFSKRGERKNFYTQPPEDGWILTLDFEEEGGMQHAGACD